MRISYQWLQDYIDLGTDMTPERLADLLTLHGIPVEVIEPMNKGISGVVTARVLETVKHPNADKLRVCTVDVGQGEPLQIVCGAPNVAPGQIVPCALVGARVFDRHTGEAMKIKRAKLRGVKSQGMLCSAAEIGLDPKLLPKAQTEGLYLLPDETPVGKDIVEVLGLSDVAMELELTPNRSDCLSFRGIAYEVAAITGAKIKRPFGEESTAEGVSPVSIRLESDGCSYYAAQVIRHVRIAPSPLWLQMRLLAVGVRPINNIVDVTNYVMFEYGQPLHAFDYAQVKGQQIIVRQARDGERLVTLDGQERELDSSMLVIADPERAIGLAGVMGGENSEVTAETTDIILESAYFDPAAIRRTGKRLGLHSEAQLRFEKGVDPEILRAALLRAANWIAALSGGRLDGAPAEVMREKRQPLHISLRLERVNQLLGTALSSGQVEQILHRLSFPFAKEGENRWQVEVPTRRNDIFREVDLIEEVARLYGYDQIPTTMPEGKITQGTLTEEQKLCRTLRHLLIGAGLSEVYTYTLSSPEWLDPLRLPEDSPLRRQIPLLMPMSEERKVLRTTLLPSLAEVAHYNLMRKTQDVALFEIGDVYLPKELPLCEQPLERTMVAAFLTGGFGPVGVGEGKRAVDFFTAKGIVEYVLKGCGVNQPRFVAAQLPGMHPGRTAEFYVGETRVGMVGELHPDVEEAWDLPESYYFELDFRLLAAVRERSFTVSPLPKFPAVDRDVAVLVPDEVSAGALLETIRQAGGDWLEEVTLFDVYRGSQVPKGMKSLAFSLVYRSHERTLTDEEVNALHAKVVATLVKEHGAEQR